MERKGIDISHHQGNINFDLLKGNIDFAMVRTSYGAFNEDRKYKQNIFGLEKIGVPYGLYHFSYATNTKSATKEANNFVDLIKNYNPTYPVVIDIEYSDRTSKVSSNTLVEIANTFCSILEESGYYVMIYANLNYFKNKLNNAILDKYDKWLAQWESKPTYDKAFGIWQYSSKGKLPGIEGNVDLNISYKDYPSIIKSRNLNTKKENYNEVIKNDYISYVVKKNDTLIKIASKYNTTYQKLQAYNNLKDPNKIFPNQIIKIPKKQDIKPTKYVVKKGDTLIKIAKYYNINWKTIYEKNKETIGDNPDVIKPGQTLII